MMEKSEKKFQNLSSLFKYIVNQHTDKPAIIFSDNKKVTFGELNKKSDQLASFLLSRGFSHKDVILFSGEKKYITYLLILACIKLGITYSAYDPNTPIQRFKKIIETCNPKLVLIGSNQDKLSEYLREKKSLKLFDETSLNKEYIKIESHQKLDDILISGQTSVYIMFTSGSTGVPKGALINNENLINFISWSKKAFNIITEDIATGLNPIYFDNSVFDFYCSIFNGASLAPIKDDIVRDPKRLFNHLNEVNCTQWFSVPSLLIYLNTLKFFNDESIPKIHKVIFGGEGFPKKKLFDIFERYKSRISFYNVYGPTECTCICSAYLLQKSDFECLEGLPTLGFMGSHFNYELLDQEVDEEGNIEGELCLKGSCVGQGYFNDQKRTFESFKPDIENGNNKLKYLTGDIIKVDNKSKKLFFVCRKDNQIKHMGYRIELEEIEAAANTFTDIKEACALHYSIKEISNIVLCIANDKEIEDRDIKSRLGKHLPSYMIPSKIYQFRVLPKNANGKIDRAGLKREIL